MDVNLFDFDLPERAIALRPASPRDTARLLHVGGLEALTDHIVRDLPELLRAGDVLVLNETRVLPAALTAIRPARAHGGGGDVTLALDAAIEAVGHPPLPPYIARKGAVDARDVEDYQTIYAQDTGSVAAPTAGLHFTDNLIAALKAKGVQFEHVTLHVGAGTFLPVKTDDTDGHDMHSEWYKEGPDGYQVKTLTQDTDIFITPGYDLQIVDGLMTNFHLPKSTLFMLVSALAGLEVMQKAYSHAIDTGYRFYSYGDSSLIWKA